MLYEVAAILEIMSSISSTLALDEILAGITEKTTQILGADSCAISRWDQEKDTIVVLADYMSPKVSVPDNDICDVGAAYALADYPATARVLHEHTPHIIYVDDPAGDECEKELLKKFQWDGVLMVPMLYKGQATGLLELYTDDKDRYQFAEDKLVLCQALANQAAVAIEHARLYQRAKEGQLYAEALQAIGQALASDLDYQSVVHKVADVVNPLVDAQFVCVAIPEADSFRVVASARRSSQAAPAASIDTSVNVLCQKCSELVLANQAPLIVDDISMDSTCAACRQEIEAWGWRAVVTVPLLSNERLVGILAAYADQPHFFTTDKVARLTALASQAAVAIQNAHLFAELETQREALRQISLRLVNAQEAERRRVSRELHDELGQSMTALKVNLDVARRALTDDAPARLRRSIEEAARLAAQTQERTRTLAWELRPAMLDDLGLISALRWELDRYEQRTGQTIHFESDLAGAVLAPELEITIYRIVSEALTNVARHAGASLVRVHIQVKEQQLVVGIEDNGRGFDAAHIFESRAGEPSLGLFNMQERAELVGGQLHITSEVGQGAQVWAEFPLTA